MVRYLSKTIDSFAKNKFVFLTGPRQIGKTTIAKRWLEEKSGTYLNWDIYQDRQSIRKIFKTNSVPSKFVVLDEIHKYPRWKTAIKGLYDGLFPNVHVLVTGSARLDTYKRGGDSLLGRYEQLRLHPLSIGELCRLPDSFIDAPPKTANEWLSLADKNKNKPKLEEYWSRLESRSGFPEPYFADDDLSQQRWSIRRKDLVLREDIRDISDIKSIALVEEMAHLLPTRASNLLSINSLREELQIAFDTAKSWIEVLERLFYCYRIRPYSQRIARSLKKETKLYLWDWTDIEDKGARFENIVASHLLKSVHYWRDLGYGDYDLAYWRDREKREVDFIILLRNRPVVAIECKYFEESPSEGLRRFSESFPTIPLLQLVHPVSVSDKYFKNGRITSAAAFLAGLV